MARPVLSPKARLIRTASKIACVVAAILLVLLIALFVVDRRMERHKGPYPKDAVCIHYEPYIERWPLYEPWRWLQVRARVTGYTYRENSELLLLRLRGLGKSWRVRVFPFKVERLPGGLLEELEAIKKDESAYVEFWHYATFFGDRRDDSEGDLTIQRSLPLGYRFTHYSLHDGTKREWGRMWGSLEAHAWDEKSGRLALTLTRDEGDAARDTFHVEVERMPEGLLARLKDLEANQGGADRARIVFSWWNAPTRSRRCLAVVADLADGRKEEQYDVWSGTHWVDWRLEGWFDGYTVDGARLTLMLVGKTDGVLRAVEFDGCTVPSGLLTVLESSKSPGARVRLKLQTYNRELYHDISRLTPDMGDYEAGSHWRYCLKGGTCRISENP